MNNSFYSTLGLAMRAGQISCGELATKELVASGKAAFVLLDNSASKNKRDMMFNAGSYYHVPVIVLEEGLLGQAIGKPGLISCAIPKGSFGKKLLELAQNNSI